ncbi:MAG TPA: ABC transporter substrate-binding protein, partial [Actinomycetota bacterium]|nr:ABC transporter substrate-binding protein [Actinomycetota bacterium]
RGSAAVLRLGYFPNLTHAPALIGLGSGMLTDALSPTRIEARTFNSGSDASQALLSGALDAAYIGPGPVVTMWVRSGKVAVVSGAVSGGASLIVRTGAGIGAPGDLRGRKVAVPGLGNTQDVALRTWLHDYGLEARDRGGDVTVMSVDNPELAHVFRSGQVDAAWEPEPWPSMLVDQGVAQRLVDESDLWPDGRFVTTTLVVSTPYLDAHPEVVDRLVDGNVAVLRHIHERPIESKVEARRQLLAEGARPLPPQVLAAAWDRLTFDWDPLEGPFEQVAGQMRALGAVEEDAPGLDGLFRLDALNTVLDDEGLPPSEADL